MTRKDYELIAATIAEQHKDSIESGQVAGAQTAINQVAERMARKLRQENPNFDQGRFLKACGVR